MRNRIDADSLFAKHNDCRLFYNELLKQSANLQNQFQTCHVSDLYQCRFADCRSGVALGGPKPTAKYPSLLRNPQTQRYSPVQTP